MIENVFQYLTLLKLVIGIIGAVLVSPIYRLLKKWIIRMKELYTISDRLKKLDDIYAQLIPNGGSSVRDSIDRIERKLAFNSEWIRITDRDSGRIVVHLDKNGNLEWANRAWLDVFGLDLQDALGQGWLSVLDRETYLSVSSEIEDALTDLRDINVSFTINGIEYTLKAKVLKQGNMLYGYLGTLNKNAKS